MVAIHSASPAGIEDLDRAATVEHLLESALHDLSSKVIGTRAPRLGVDVVDTEVLARQLGSAIGSEFKLRIFTKAEIADCRNQIAKFGTRWAVKEAVSKAIGTGFRLGLHPRAIEVLTSPAGSIRVAPTCGHRWPHGAEEWNWSVAAAHDGGVAVAVAVAVLP